MFTTAPFSVPSGVAARAEPGADYLRLARRETVTRGVEDRVEVVPLGAEDSGVRDKKVIDGPSE